MRQLSKNFWKENPLKEISFATLSLFLNDIHSSKKADDAFSDLLTKYSPKHISQETSSNKEMIENASSAEEIVKVFRKGCDFPNEKLLFEKTLTMGEEVFPLLLQRYKTSCMDKFIELTAHILVKADIKYTEQLFDMYKDIRNPYAKAHACIVFGMKNMQEKVDFLLEEYQKFSRLYPNESFEQGPLLAIYLIYNKY